MRSISRCLALVLLCTAAPTSRGDDAIPPEVINHIKAATVFIKVRTGPLEASGTGFLMQAEGDTALIVTNEHVVAPPKGLSLPPTRYEVIFHSGRKTERSFAATLVAADADRDLAVLRVKGAEDLPKPLDIAEKVELAETMPVYLFGFPFGKALSASRGNPAITIGRGGISSLREDDRGKVTVIQIDGDLNPGNSGGPVVDRKGRLVGVAVAKIRGTNIGMAVPAAELTEMLLGRVSGITRRVVKVENGAAELEFRLQFIDPLNRVNKAQILYAPADAVTQPVRPDKDGKFPPLPNASIIELTVENQVGVGRVTLKSDAAPAVNYYFQPAYVRGDKTLTHVSAGKPQAISFTALAKGGGPKDPKTPVDPRESKTTGLPDVEPQRVGDVKVRSIPAGNGSQSCMCWSADGKAFYALDGDGVVRRFSYPDLKEEATNAIGRKCGWLSVSALGVVATVRDAQEAWLLDPVTLKEGKKATIAKAQYCVSSPKLNIAFAAEGGFGGGTITVIDLKTGKQVKQFTGRDFGGRVGFDRPVVSGDGKWLFTTGGIEQVFRFRISGQTLTPVDFTDRIIQGAFVGLSVSNEGDFVCAPSGGGNYGANYSTYIYSSSNLKKQLLTVSSGAYPSAVGFDVKSGLIYAQNHESPLIVFDLKGIKQKEFALKEDPKTRSVSTRQFLVHPAGRQLVLLAEADINFKREPRIYTVELTSESDGTAAAPAPKEPPADPKKAETTVP
jgi:S1-C subfamily serine protease